MSEPSTCSELKPKHREIADQLVRLHDERETSAVRAVDNVFSGTATPNFLYGLDHLPHVRRGKLDQIIDCYQEQRPAITTPQSASASVEVITRDCLPLYDIQDTFHMEALEAFHLKVTPDQIAGTLALNHCVNRETDRGFVFDSERGIVSITNANGRTRTINLRDVHYQIQSQSVGYCMPESDAMSYDMFGRATSKIGAQHYVVVEKASVKVACAATR